MIILALTLLGLCLGSFVNALVWRTHEQENLVLSSKFSVLGKSQKRSSKKIPDRRTQNPELSILHGRSMCPSCRHTLAAKDLVPVFSWLWLKGKCRYCNKPIAGQYPLVELLTAVLFAVSYIYWPNAGPGTHLTWMLGLWLVMLTGLIALAVYDFKWYLLPNKIIYPLFAPAVAWVIVSILDSGDKISFRLSELVFSVAISGGIFFLLYQVSSGKWIGGGDVRLGWLLGLIVLTPSRAVLLIFLASLGGSLLSLPMLLNHKLKKTSIVPFGPFLIAAAIFVVLFGASFLGWYSGQFLL
ncbi:MAG TPA: prepilin peptidase [Candidatus Saccharimonadales bacterium]|nr:prepilin peptidase [Candidatus Saccharimonadales bacterium]